MSAFGGRFLQDADVFPDLVDGAPCGHSEVVVDFAGGPYLFTGLSPQQVAGVEQRFEGFCRRPVPGERFPVQTRVASVGEAAFRDPGLKDEDYFYDTDYSASLVRLAGWNFMAALAWRPALGGVLWTRNPDELTAYGVFENYFRVLVAYRLLELGGVLLHSAAVVAGGCARLFFGRSGAGKSTVSRMAAATGGQILSDDLNAVVGEGDGLACQKVPFAGDFGRTRKGDELTYPICGIYRLKQGGALAVRPLSPADALAALIICSPFVNHDPHRADQLLSSLEAVVSRGEVGELTFSLDSDLRGAIL